MGKSLPGLSRLWGSKTSFDILHGGEFHVVEHKGHELALLDADAVFAAQAAIFAHAHPTISRPASWTRSIARCPGGRDENEGMQVAVAGVQGVPARKP